MEVDDDDGTDYAITASWPDAEVMCPPAERRQFHRVQCANKAMCCPRSSERVYVLIENISRLGMAARIWSSDLEAATSVDIILSTGVILPAMVARVTGFGTNQVVAFELGRLLTEMELSSFLTPI